MFYDTGKGVDLPPLHVRSNHLGQVGDIKRRVEAISFVGMMR